MELERAWRRPSPTAKPRHHTITQCLTHRCRHHITRCNRLLHTYGKGLHSSNCSSHRSTVNWHSLSRMHQLSSRSTDTLHRKACTHSYTLHNKACSHTNTLHSKACNRSNTLHSKATATHSTAKYAATARCSTAKPQQHLQVMQQQQAIQPQHSIQLQQPAQKQQQQTILTHQPIQQQHQQPTQQHSKHHSSKRHRAPLHHHNCVSCHHPLQHQTLDTKAAHHSPAHQQDSPSYHQWVHPQLTASTSATFQTRHRMSDSVPSTRLSSMQWKTHQPPNQPQGTSSQPASRSAIADNFYRPFSGPPKLPKTIIYP